MRSFRATAFNAAGLTFGFHFQNENWVGVEEAAKKRLAEIVAADPLHQKHGPWNVRAIDVGHH